MNAAKLDRQAPTGKLMVFGYFWFQVLTSEIQNKNDRVQIIIDRHLHVRLRAQTRYDHKDDLMEQLEEP